MKLPSKLIKLPLKFDHQRLVQEVSQFSDSDWTSNPSGLVGNSGLILVSVGGEINDEFAISGQMKGTRFLQHCSYIQQVLKAMQAPISRSRLMRLKPKAGVNAHLDARYHWYRRIRIHIPIITHPDIQFFCDDISIHMKPGEAWTFDGSLPHGVINPTEYERIHLVIDTQGSDALEKLLQPNSDIPKQFVSYREGEVVDIEFEPYRFEVLTPQEIKQMTTRISQDSQSVLPQKEWLSLVYSIDKFTQRWENVFYTYGHNQAGQSSYQEQLSWFEAQIKNKLTNHLHKHSLSWYYVSVIEGMLTISNRVYE